MPHQRDARVDFFRGMALFFIFIDHVPNNWLSKVTLQNFGFIDAADVFVGLAGYASFMAYHRAFDGSGWIAGAKKIGRRMRELYLAHLSMFILCVGGMAALSYIAKTSAFEDLVDFEPFIDEPANVLRHALSLTHLPTYMDILPLYIVLLAWLPILLWLGRIHIALAIAISVSLWLGANLLDWNLPNYAEDSGWTFNPFAWQLLFGLGVWIAYLQRQDRSMRLPGLLPLSLAFAAFAFVFAAPWSLLPGLENTRPIANDTLLSSTSKQNLSLWRVVHFAALVYVAAYAIPINGAWLKKPVVQLLVDCGKHSLPVFCFGIVLAIAGGVVMRQYGPVWPLQLAVNALGIGALALAGWALSRPRNASASPGDPQQPLGG